MSKGGTKENNLPRKFTRRGANDTEQSELEPILLNDEDEKRSNASSSSVHSIDATLDFMKQMMMEMQRKEEEDRKEQERTREEVQKTQEWRDELIRTEWEKRERDAEERRVRIERELEEKRMQHERDMLERQHQLEQERKEESDKKRIANRIMKMEDTDQPDAYFCRFEDTMNEAGIKREEWPQRLRALLSGKSLAAYANTVPKEAKDDYEALKEALLQALGLTTEQCRLDFWTLKKQYGETWQEMARKIDSMVFRMIQGCKSVEEVSNMLSIHNFFSLCPAEAVNYAQVRQPKSSLEAANLVQYYLRRQSRDRRDKPWNKHGQSSDVYGQVERKRQDSVNGSNSSSERLSKYSNGKLYENPNRSYT